MSNSTTDARTARQQDADAAWGNARIKFAVFAREYLMQHSLATVAEARAAYEKEAK